MSRVIRRRFSTRVFGASSSPIRMEILRALSFYGPLSYSEIMVKLNLDPSKHAGRFAYHLRSVQRANLVEPTKDGKKYCLTDLGARIVSFQQELEEYALKRGGRLLVRTSRLAIEDFDRSRIVASLIKEAQTPADLADKIAREVEERLLGLQVKYLTAPLIREIVNAVLIEKGLEEYRHRLTRLGLPVYDVTQKIVEASRLGLNGESLRHMAGDAVLREYVLLNVLPRDIADAHLSGLIHIGGDGSWILKPDYFQHDPRFLLKDGLPARDFILSYSLSKPPRNIQTFLNGLIKAFEASEKEVAKEQCIDSFNFFLAPYAKGLSDDELTKAIEAFFMVLAKPREVGERPTISLALELGVPRNLKDVKVLGPSKEQGTYEDYADEALRIASAILRVLREAPGFYPILVPQLILKIRPEDFRKNVEVLLAFHELAGRDGTPFFAFLKEESLRSRSESYWADGLRLTSNGHGMEEENLRASIIGDVTINLPRIAFEAGGDDSAFDKGLEDALRLAFGALEVRNKVLYDRIREGLLPFLFQGNGEPYCRFELMRLTVSALGLYEATLAYTGRSLTEDRSARLFAEKVVERMANFVDERKKETGERLQLTCICDSEVTERLAKVDEEKFGQVVSKVQGNRNAIYYTNLGIVPFEAEVSLDKRLEVEGSFSRFYLGGQITILQLDDGNAEAQNLLRISEKASKFGIPFLAYSKKITWCWSCREAFSGLLSQCPKCSSTRSLLKCARQDGRYQSLRYWSRSRRMNLDRIVLYGTEQLKSLQ
ncbi:MAG: anaerobic ribonucleoside-triphosphate reductase [Candidatus Bathyarchaeia archaeon]